MTALDDRRRPVRLALVAAAAVVAVVIGGVGIAQVMTPGDQRGAASPRQGQVSTDSSEKPNPPADDPLPPRSPGRLLVSDVRDVSIESFDSSFDGGLRRAITFDATVANVSSRNVTTRDCQPTAVQVGDGPVRVADVRDDFPGPADIDCRDAMRRPLQPGQTVEDFRFSARIPLEDEVIFGQSVRWFLPDRPEAAVTFVMSDDAPLRVVGVLTVAEPPAAEDRSFTLAYENPDAAPVFPPCGLALLRLWQGEAFVGEYPSVRCFQVPIPPGETRQLQVDVELPPGTDRVRVVGPRGSQIVVPLP